MNSQSENLFIKVLQTSPKPVFPSRALQQRMTPAEIEQVDAYMEKVGYPTCIVEKSKRIAQAKEQYRSLFGQEPPAYWDVDKSIQEVGQLNNSYCGMTLEDGSLQDYLNKS